MPLFALPKTPAAEAQKSRLGYVAQESVLSGEEGLSALLEKVELFGLTREDVVIADAPDIGTAVKNPQAFTISSTS